MGSIRSQLCLDQPPIVLVTVDGRLTLPAITNSRDFGDVVRSLAGKPFRVLCDFTRTITMPEDVCAVFMRGQEFALARGMERDAFACTSSVLRLQFARIARESGRAERLGPLQFFDTLAEARACLEAPAAPSIAGTNRRLPPSEPEPDAPSRAGPLSLRAGAPSRPHSRG